MNDEKPLRDMTPVERLTATRPNKGKQTDPSYHRLTCKVCERQFASRRKDAKTCGSICRQRWYRHTTGTPGSIKRWVKDHL